MKEDPIKRLVKESRLETSEGFTDITLEKLNSKLERRIVMRLYALIIFAITFFLAIAFILITSNFSLEVFGVLLSIPKIGTMIGLSLIAYFTVLKLIHLLNFGGLRKANIT